MSAPRPVIAAAADAGANSVHLLVAELADDRLQPLADESVFLDLGRTVDVGGELGPAARDALAAALAGYAARARALGAVRLAFVGTEPLRRARDAAVAAAEVERLSGVPLLALSHEEEGWLTALGVTGGRPVSRRMLVVDVGGGSSEFVLVSPAEEPRVWALPLGSARLTERFVRHDPPTATELVELRAAAREVLDGAPAAEADELVAVGGTADNLVRIAPAAATDQLLDRSQLAAALAALAVDPAAVFGARHGLNPRRTPLLPAGAAILEAVLRRYRADHLRASEAGIREGLVLALCRAGDAWREILPELVPGRPGRESRRPASGRMQGR